MIRLIITLILLFTTYLCFSYKVTVEIDNYQNDTLMLGYYYGDNQYINDTSICQDRDKFVFNGKEDLPAGMYLIIMKPGNRFVQIVMPEKDQRLKLSFDSNDPFSTLKAEDQENQLFISYLNFLSSSRTKAQELNKALELVKMNTQEQTEFQMKLDQIDAEVKAEQNRIISDFPKSMVALIINTNEDVEIPEFSGSESEIQEQQYDYYVKHYFDKVDFQDDRLSYTAFLLPKVNRYVDQIIPQIPDSINKALDLVLSRAEGTKNNFKLLLVSQLNKYANSKFVGMDAVYVHLVKNYYAKGKAPWTTQEHLVKMTKNAETLEPLLIGKTAPNIKVFRKDKSPVVLHDIDAKYIALFFWAPDCGHCKKSLPKLKELYPELQNRGVEVLAICTKLLEKEQSCWDFLEENEIDLWIDATDRFLKSRFKQIYDVSKTPQLYLLDENKTILTKKIGVEQLIDVLNTLEGISSE